MKKYAYFVINDTDDLDALQDLLCRFASEIDDTIIDYSMDKKLRLANLIKVCNHGDIIYTPYLGRIAKSLGSLYDIVSLANDNGVEIFFCDKKCAYFSQSSATGQINISALEWATEIDLEIRRARILAAVSANSDELRRKGSRITKRGTVQTHWGNKKGTKETRKITSIASEASAQKSVNDKMVWKEQSMAVDEVLRRHAAGYSITEITAIVGELYDNFSRKKPDEPNPYGTRQGCKPQKGTVSKWIREANPQSLAADKEKNNTDDNTKDDNG